MAYNAWSVVAFEQPSAAKWNQLGANDAGFRDGTNLDDLIILLRHINWQDNLPPEGFLIGGYITRNIVSNDLVVAIKTESGADPSASEPVRVVIGGVLRSITAALSITIADGANTFNAGGAELSTQELDLFVYLGWRTAGGGSVVIGLARFPTALTYAGFSSTNTNDGYGVFSATPASTDVVTVIGRTNAILSASPFLWSAPATEVTVSRPIYVTRQLVFAPQWTASVNPAIGNGTLRGRYQLMQDRQFVDIDQAMGSTSTYGTGEFNWSMPFVAASNSVGYIGSGYSLDAGTAYRHGAAKASPNARTMIVYTNAGSAGWSATIPHTWANTDTIQISNTTNIKTA
jgi:hypothetical protein